MISVCVPVYNGQDFIQECIQSILSQTFQDIEILVSDDASTDKTLEILTNEYSHFENIFIMSNKENKGWVKNCNLLVARASRAYYCIIPHDDIIPPEYLQTLFNKIHQDHTISNCFPFIQCFGDPSNVLYQSTIDTDHIFDRVKTYITTFNEPSE